MITGDYFSHLDLGKNNLGNLGLSVLLRGLRQNCSLIHLDLGSNDITYEGATQLFAALHKHLTLTSLTLANHDRLHRNRMGYKACEALGELLVKNKVITMINIADNGISNEGLKGIAKAFTEESNLVSVNLSNNDLSGESPINSLATMLAMSKTFIELNLTDNAIGDSGIIELAKIFTENASKLMKLNISNIGCTAHSIGKLFFSIKSNNFLTHLTLDGNDLSG